MRKNIFMAINTQTIHNFYCEKLGGSVEITRNFTTRIDAAGKEMKPTPNGFNCTHQDSCGIRKGVIAQYEWSECTFMISLKNG